MKFTPMEKPSDPRFKDLTGQKFNMLTVVDFAGKVESKNNRARVWHCRCDCGNMTTVTSSNLKNGNTKSCGCYNVERASRLNYKHGLSQHPLFKTFLSMNKRCNYPKHHNYRRYGGRGITICERWNTEVTPIEIAAHNYVNDIEKHLGEKPFPKAEIDRIDNDGNYEIGNVRWVDRLTNNLNKEMSHGHTSNGGKKRTPTWNSWNNAKTFYKGQMCEEWLGKGIGFKVFLKDMGEKPEGSTLKRHDLNKPFSKLNCYWT